MLNTRPQSRAIVRGTLIISVLALVLGVWMSGSRPTDASRLHLTTSEINGVLQHVTDTMRHAGEITSRDSAVALYAPLAAHDNATNVDWLYLQVAPHEPASYLAQVSFQDSGSQWLLTRQPGKAWRRVTDFYFPPCARMVPTSVATLWKWQQTGPYVPPSCAAIHPPR